jgi:hypothetical protein
MKAKNYLIMALVCLMSVCLSQTKAIAQEHQPGKKIVKVVGKKGKDDSKIKMDKPAKDAKAIKSKTKCSVYFNNYSGYFVNVYMDGFFWGTVGPYGGMTVMPGNGYSTIYCVSTGGLWSWSASGTCSTPYEYDLTPGDSDY